jgi:hypothetical protein
MTETADKTTQRRVFWALLIFTLSIFVFFFVVPNFVDVPLRISEETTLITEPFFPDSQRLDYVSVLQKRFGPDDPHKNGFRMVVQAVGGEPMERASGYTWESICRQLDLNPLDPPTMPRYSKAWTILEQGESPVKYYIQLEKCATDLWTQEQFPFMNDYLDEVSPVLDLLREAVCKEYYFMPQVTRTDYGYAFLPCHGSNHEFGNGLSARANRSIRDGQFEAAWRDIIAALRLSSHLQNDMYILSMELLRQPFAFSAAERLLERSELSEEQLRQCIEDIKQLPKRTVSIEDLAMCQRYTQLGAISFYSNAPRLARKELLSDLKCDIPGWGSEVFGFNWNLVARILNEYYDRQMQIYRRNLSDADLEREIDSLVKDYEAKYSFGTIPLVTLRDARSGYIAHKLAWVLPLVELGKHVKADRVRHQLLIFAFELEIEKRNNGRYPATLDFLNDRYTPEELTDPFNGEPFEYQPNADGNGYRLFSIEAGAGIAVRSEEE